MRQQLSTLFVITSDDSADQYFNTVPLKESEHRWQQHNDALLYPLDCQSVVNRLQTIYNITDKIMGFKKQTTTDPTFWISVHDSTFDSIRWRIINSGRYYERGITNQLEQILSGEKPGLVVDASANIGWYTLLARSFNHSVVSIEPNPLHHLRLCESLERNHWIDDVRIFPYGIGTKSGPMKLEWPVEDPQDGKLKKPGQENTDDSQFQAVSANATTLDQLASQEQWIESMTPFHLLKINAMDPKVVLGGRRLIASKRIQNIIMECNFRTPGFALLLRLLHKSGYELHYVGDAVSNEVDGVVSFLKRPMSSGEFSKAFADLTRHLEMNELWLWWRQKQIPKGDDDWKTRLGFQQEAEINTTRHNYAIALIAMGPKETAAVLAERTIRSIRAKGRFEGPIMIITDHDELYNHLLVSYANVTVLSVNKDDFASGTHGKMKYKRFKTQILDLLDRIPSLNTIDRVLYLDFDIVVGANLQDFFDQVQQHVSSLPPPRESRMFLFPERGSLSDHEAHHTGIMLLERPNSKQCLELWRRVFDTTTFVRDQKVLGVLNTKLKENSTDYAGCKLEFFPPSTHHHFHLPICKSLERRIFHTFEHFTNTAFAKHCNDSAVQGYLSDILELSAEERTANLSIAQRAIV